MNIEQLLKSGTAEPCVVVVVERATQHVQKPMLPLYRKLVTRQVGYKQYVYEVMDADYARGTFYLIYEGADEHAAVDALLHGLKTEGVR